MSELGNKTKNIMTASAMAAFIFVVTWIVRVPLPFAPGGYLNLGDVPIYLTAWLVGGPYAAVAAALGSALADLIGFPLYAVPTAIIKGGMALIVGIMTTKVRTRTRFVISSAIAGAVMVAGYAAFETVFLFSFDARLAIAGIAQNSIQWVGCVIIAALLYPAMKPAEKILRK
jgi:uncharacterized membrane protein